MSPDKFVRQDQGPHRFDRWQWPERAPTQLGELLVEITTCEGETAPDAAMAAAASGLAEFAAANGDMLLDLIYGHYKYAEENGWLVSLRVKPGLGHNRILKHVESITLAVRRDRKGRLDAGVFINPLWDPEHKLDLAYREGRIVAVNGGPFILDGEVLRPARGSRAESYIVTSHRVIYTPVYMIPCPSLASHSPPRLFRWCKVQSAERSENPKTEFAFH